MEEAASDDDDGGGGGGAPAWMATFADLMSLLLAFFVLLFSFASIDDSVYKQVGGSMKEAFGVQRRVPMSGEVLGISFIAMEYSAARPDKTQLNVVPQENLDRDKVWESDQYKGFSEDDADKKAAEESSTTVQEEKKKAQQEAEDSSKKEKSKDSSQGQIIGAKRGMTQAEQAALAVQKEDIAAQLAQKKAKELGTELASEIANGSMSIETAGNKVIIRIPEEASFPPGASITYAGFNESIKKIATVVKDSPGRVVVEGHTDNMPIENSRFRSNWELSSSRAASVVHGLINSVGLPEDRFEVRGLSDTKPIATNRTAKGRAKNRRVEVVIEYDAKDLVPDELKPDIEISEAEKERMAREAEKEKMIEADPTLELYRGFEKSLEDSQLQDSGSTAGSSEEFDLIFKDDFFR